MSGWLFFRWFVLAVFGHRSRVCGRFLQFSLTRDDSLMSRVVRPRFNLKGNLAASIIIGIAWYFSEKESSANL
jgi:hypothetical protein